MKYSVFHGTSSFVSQEFPSVFLASSGVLDVFEGPLEAF